MKGSAYNKTSLKMIALTLMATLVAAMLNGCEGKDKVQIYRTQEQLQGEAQWTMGFGACDIAMPEDDSQPYYIAGYNNG